MKTTWNIKTNEFTIEGIKNPDRAAIIHALYEARNAALRRIADLDDIKDTVPEVLEDEREEIADYERLIDNLRTYIVMEDQR